MHYLRNRYGDALVSEDAHYKTGKYLSRIHYSVGVPSIVFTGFVASGFYTELYDSSNGVVFLFLGGASVIATVLVSLQTFLGLQELAEKHRVAGSRYYSIRMHIDSLLLNSEICESDVNTVKNDLAAIAESAPNIPEIVWKRSIKKR